MEKIDWENLTKEDAQEMADLLCAKFSVVAKCWQSDRHYDVSYLTVVGLYDDEFHANKY